GTGTASGTVSVTGSGLSYTVTISNITGDGFLGISIGGSTAVDQAGNVALAAGPSPTFFAVVNHAPTVSISQPSAAYGTSYANGITSITYTVTYNSPAFGASTLTAANITLNATGGASGTVSVTAGSGSTRTVTISNLTGNGTLGISVAASTGMDQLGHMAGAAGPGPTFIVDNVAPTIAVAGPSATYAAGGPITYTVTYADAYFNSSTLAPANITLNKSGTANGTISVSGSGLTRTVTISGITGDGTLGISVAAGTAADLAGNQAPAAGASTTFIVDNTNPTILVSAPLQTVSPLVPLSPPNAAASGPVYYTVTYADANFNTCNLAPWNVNLISTGTVPNTQYDPNTNPSGIVVGITGSGLTRTITLSHITGDGSLGISIVSGTASDLAGNLAPTSGPSTTFIVDNTLPVTTISGPSASSTSAGPVTYTVTYTDANFSYSNLAKGNVTLNATGTATGTVSVVSGFGTVRKVTISSIKGDGTLGISIGAGTASDYAGNTATAAGPSTTFNVVNSNLGVFIGAPSASYTAGGSISYTVTYVNATNITLAPANITLNKTLTANGTVSVSGTGLTTRTVTISGITGDGTLGISIAAGTSTDAQNDQAPPAGPSTTFTVDNTAPTISVGAPSASYAAGGPVTYLVTYGDANFNTSTLAAANITLNKSGTANGTISVSGSGLTRTVTISSISGDGSLGISVAAGTATDLAGNQAPASGASQTFIVDNTAPSIVIGAPSAAYTAGGPITYTVTYADAHFNTSTLAAANITLNSSGTATGTISSVSGSGLTRTVTVSSITGDGSLGISIAAGTATDLAGNLTPAAG
ncbi:MAG: hypothetical protein ABSH20_29390, partial [Tepidisphaeraceae bacterium]